MLPDLQFLPTPGWQRRARLQMFGTHRQARKPFPKPLLARGFAAKTLDRSSPLQIAQLDVTDLGKRHPGAICEEEEEERGKQAAPCHPPGVAPAQCPPWEGAAGTDGWTDRQLGLTWDVVDGYSEDHQQNSPPAAAAAHRGAVLGHGERRGAVGWAGPCALPPLVRLPVFTFV